MESITIQITGPCTIKNSRYTLQCGDCGIPSQPKELQNVIKTLPDGREKQMIMCADCIDIYEQVTV